MTAARPHQRFGPSTFETIEILDGQPLALAEHLDLLVSTAEALRLPPPDLDLIHTAVAETVSRWGPGPGRLRLSWSRIGGRNSLHLFLTPLIIPTRSARVRVAEFPVDTSSPLFGLKSSGMSLGVAIMASHPDADEVLLGNESGELTEGCSSNIFLVSGDSLVTPPLSSGCRAGVTRSAVLAAAHANGIPLREQTVMVQDLHEVDEAFLTSTGRHIQPIASIAGRPLRPDGALTKAAREAFLEARRLPEK